MLAAAKGGCAFYNEPLVYYRRHQNNTIGSNNDFISGIKSKTRQVRIEDYSYRYESVKKIMKEMKISRDEELSLVLKLNKAMIEFYKEPSIKKLLNIRRIPGYYELAKKNVQKWEWIVAFRLDILIRKIVRKM